MNLRQHGHHFFADPEHIGTGSSAYIASAGLKQWDEFGKNVVGTSGNDGWEFYVVQDGDERFFAFIEDNDYVLVKTVTNITVYERHGFTFDTERETAKELEQLAGSVLFQQS